MLGIQPGGTPISPLPPPMTPRTLSDVGFDNNLDSPHHSDKLRKHHSFRLSFKRKDGRREHRDSLNGPVPAKFIRATSIKSHTLSPKWHEKFKLYVYSFTNTSFFLSFIFSFSSSVMYVCIFFCCCFRFRSHIPYSCRHFFDSPFFFAPCVCYHLYAVQCTTQVPWARKGATHFSSSLYLSHIFCTVLEHQPVQLSCTLLFI